MTVVFSKTFFEADSGRYFLEQNDDIVHFGLIVNSEFRVFFSPALIIRATITIEIFKILVTNIPVYIDPALNRQHKNRWR